MDVRYKTLEEQIFLLNEDKKFYRDYYEAGQSSRDLQSFLSCVDQEDAIRRHLVIPDLLPEIISYEMNDEEYFKEGEQRNVYISQHNRYTPAFLHRHNFFEIVFVYHGTCTQNIGTTRKSFSDGDVIFIAPGVYHTMEVFQDQSIVFNILIQQKTFHQTFLPLASGNNLQSQFFKEGLYNQHRLEYLVYHTQDSWKSFVLKMYYEHLNHDAFSDQILIGMMTYLSADMMRRFQGTMESSYSSSHTRGLEDFLVLNYIQEHIDTVTLADISRHFGFSLSYCSKLIKNTTGMGFSEWKRALRVRKGERLLVNTTDTVNDISLSLGYENTETFIRIFKKETGMTPGQYRKRGQKRPAD